MQTNAHQLTRWPRFQTKDGMSVDVNEVHKHEMAVERISASDKVA
jgi:hypothetical protein